MSILLGGAAAASASSAFVSAPGARSHAEEAGGIKLGGRQTLTLVVRGLAPGEAVRSQELILNDDSKPLRYALSSATLDEDGKGIHHILRVTIRTADLASGSTPPCDRFDGPTLYQGPLGSESAGFGDLRTGGQPGDRVLAPEEAETLCFEVTMSLSAGNEYQGASASTTWTIAAEQEASNP
jgi:hypothetical protein